MDQRLLFALIGALPGLVPALLLYLQRKKEIAANLPLGILTAATTAEAGLRSDLQNALNAVRAENKDLKAEIKLLNKRIDVLESFNFAIRDAWLKSGNKMDLENLVRKNEQELSKAEKKKL